MNCFMCLIYIMSIAYRFYCCFVDFFSENITTIGSKLSSHISVAYTGTCSTDVCYKNKGFRKYIILLHMHCTKIKISILLHTQFIVNLTPTNSVH